MARIGVPLLDYCGILFILVMFYVIYLGLHNKKKEKYKILTLLVPNNFMTRFPSEHIRSVSDTRHNVGWVEETLYASRIDPYSEPIVIKGRLTY